MAKAVVDGASGNENVEVELSYHVGTEELTAFDAILVGTETGNHETPIHLKQLLEEASAQGINLKGKIGAAFGSYGWSGEASKAVLEILKNKFEMHVIELPIMANYAPDQNALTACRDLGKKISDMIVR